MIEVGESLGNRYKVAKAPEELRLGAVFELSDRGVALVLGQVLAEEAVPPAMVQEVRGDLTVVPAMPTILKPRDIALTARGVPVGVLERPGLVRLRDRLAALPPEQKAGLATTLLRATATIASDLAMIHQSGQVHGAIHVGALLCNSVGEVTGALLTGFGVTSFARRLGKLAKEPSARGDLVDLLGALHDLFLVAGVQPDGGAAAKWTLLRHAAQHGEHPALASGNALATQLNEIASIAVADERPRPSRMPTMNAPSRRPGTPIDVPTAGTGRANTLPPTSRRTLPPSGRGSVSVGARAEPPRPRRWRFSVGILVGGLAVIGLLGSAAAYFIWDARTNVGSGRLVQPRRAVVARAACVGEPAEGPTSMELAAAPAEFDAVCGEGRLLVAARSGTQLQLAQRGGARGQRFSEPLRVGDGVVELGTLLPGTGAAWVSWRNGVGAPFAFARIDAHGATVTQVPLQGWDNVAVRGAALLHVDARSAWLVTTVIADAGSHAVLVEAGLGERPRLATWFLDRGVAVAHTAGPNPTVLMDLGAAGGHQLTAVSLDLAALGALPTQGTTVRGADLPPAAPNRPAAVSRSGPLSVDGEVLVASAHGVTSGGGARAFLVTTGGPRPAESCVAPNRCVAPGDVFVLSFPASGTGQAVRVAQHAWGEDLRVAEGERVEAITRAAGPSDAPQSFRTSTGVDLARGEVSPGRSLDASGTPRARLVACGEDVWVVQDASASARVSATPLTCIERR